MVTSEEKLERAKNRLNKSWQELHYAGLGVPLDKAAKRYQRAEWVLECRSKGMICPAVDLTEIRICGAGKWGTRSEPGKPSVIW